MVAISAGALAATVQWSDGDGNSGTFTNATWADLQTAIQNAENNPTTPGYIKVSGDLQRVQNDPTTGDLRIRRGGLEMSGGWNDGFTAQTGKSVLDVNASATYTNRVLTISGTNVVVRDFVMTKGGLKGYNVGLRGYGAGIFVTGPNVRLESLVVTNNVRYDNYVTGGGIAIYGANAYNVTVSRCKVVNNTARTAGGIWVTQNAGRNGRPVVIEYCDILDNVLSQSSGSSGAGLYLGESADNVYIRALIANCRIRGTNYPPHHVPPLYFTSQTRYSPYFHSLTDAGASSTNLEGNVEALPLFVGSGSDKYQLKNRDTTSIDNGLTRAGAGYTYVDINCNGSYDAYLDIVVAGTPPGSDHFYYPTDLLGNQRISQGGIDRGAYEFTPPKGSVVIVR